MKKKFLILSLCFTLIFSSINFNKSYADGGVVSLPILATVCSLAVASDVALSSNDDLYDLGRMFYDYIDRNNDLTWDTIKTVFSTSVVLLNNGLVSVKSDFLDIVKDFLNDCFHSSSSSVGVFDSLPIGSLIPLTSNKVYYGNNLYSYSDGSLYHGIFYSNLRGFASTLTSTVYTHILIKSITKDDTKLYLSYDMYSSDKISSFNNTISISSLPFNFDLASIPYNGSYDWDNVESKKENESISLPIPGNLGHLVGQGSTDFWDNTDNLVGLGGLTIPNVDDPSISVDDSISFPNVGDTDIPNDTPSDTPFANITEYIIGLVVPSDSYWTDTFGGLYNNFTSSFPMVDMDNFNNLVTGEKKFPNIDINIMGVKGRVVNGDVVNSIVDWLRPIIAGFMMLCLMLFNYRKIYKTIRGVEPFQGIAQGTSDFRTGISEYNYMGSGLSKSDYEANEMELAKALHDYYEDTGKTYKVKI